jgi:very-short-patch-repair endonuclease
MERHLAELAEQQHGVVERRQALAWGVSPSAWRRWTKSDRWEVLGSRVIRRVGAPKTGEQAVMAAVLQAGPGAVASRATALALFGVPGWDLEPPHVVVPRRAVRPITGAVVHTTTMIDDRHVTTVAGIPSATPIRALFDVAGRVHPKKLERALDNAWARRLVTYALLHRTLDELAERGRPGIAVLRELAEARPADYRPPESTTEGRVNELLDAAGMPTLRRQVNAGDQRNWIGRIDLRDPELPLLVEVQSELFHGSKLDRERDEARRALLTAAGWTVLEVWETEVWRRSSTLVTTIAEARRRLRRQLRPPAA